MRRWHVAPVVLVLGLAPGAPSRGSGGDPFAALRQQLAGFDTLALATRVQSPAWYGLSTEYVLWARRDHGWTVEPARGVRHRWRGEAGLVTTWDARAGGQAAQGEIVGLDGSVLEELWREVTGGLGHATWTEATPPLSSPPPTEAWASVDLPFPWADGLELYLGVDRATERWIGFEVIGRGVAVHVRVADAVFDAPLPDHVFDREPSGAPRPIPAVWDEHLLGEDPDRDRVRDRDDNCPDAPNPAQQDLDGDRWGDACDADVDGNGQIDAQCGPVGPGPDRDRDGLPDRCDPTFDVPPLRAQAGSRLGTIRDRLRVLPFDATSALQQVDELDRAIGDAANELAQGRDAHARLGNAARIHATLRVELDAHAIGAGRELSPQDAAWLRRRLGEVREVVRSLEAEVRRREP